MTAAGYGHLDVCRLLLDKGADVNLRARRVSHTALMLASLNGDLSVVQLLVNAGADTHFRDKDGETALENNVLCKCEISEDLFVVALVTPFMARVHEEVQQSGELVFLDATGNVDR